MGCLSSSPYLGLEYGVSVQRVMMNPVKERVLLLVDKHAQKASKCEYDRAVAITAISAAREAVLTIPDDLPPHLIRPHALAELAELMADYHDPDGQYTSGKSVIGSLYDEVASDSN